MEIPHSFNPNKAPTSASTKKNRFPLDEEEPIKGPSRTVRSRPQLKAPGRSQMIAAGAKTRTGTLMRSERAARFLEGSG